jgi:geranylgeranyl pyrophosphate synthase
MIDLARIPSDLGIDLRAWRDAAEDGLRRAAPAREPLASLYRGILDHGRRFRPLLVQAGHLACGGAPERVTGVAVAVELLHKASCVHDDVMDGDGFRRGVPTAHHTHGNATAVVFGDYLVAAAWRELHRALTAFPADVRQRCADELARVFVAMCEGQAEPLATVPARDARDAPVSDYAAGSSDTPYWDRAYAKTGSLIEGALALGALAAGAAEHHRPLPALRAIGRAAGIAFQLINDLNGLIGVEARSGKLPCGDAVRGEPTWPLHLLDQALRSPDRAFLDPARPDRAALDPTSPDRAALDPACMRDLLHQTGVADRVRGHVASLLTDCLRHAAEISHPGVRTLIELLATSPDSPYWSALDAPSPGRRGQRS